MALPAIFKPLVMFRRYHKLSLRDEQAQDSLLELGWESVGTRLSVNKA